MSNQEEVAYQAAYREAHWCERRAYDMAHRSERCSYDASRYAANREAILERSNGECAEFHEWLSILRTVNGCEDCGTHDGLLEHHHVDPDTKLYSVSQMYSYSLDALEDELEKCVVLCRPCHGRRHVEMESIAA